MTRILASDLLVSDEIVTLAGHPALQPLMQKYQLTPGGKTNISKETSAEFARVFAKLPRILQPGGSSANFLCTLARLLPDEVEGDYIGVIGRYDKVGDGDRKIWDSLKEANIRLLPHHQGFAPSFEPETAVSYVIVIPGGQRTVATYSGNARHLLTPDRLENNIMLEHDILLLQGALWQKLEWGYADRLLALRRQYNRTLWLTLPTYAEFSFKHAAFFRSSFPQPTFFSATKRR